ncbi:hypothetical protein ACSFA7_21855 [Variovorax sp. LT1R20]|uniref:hypothetical protein n=1 Tax=Variovorax sp. LT1R20 TaxID=3443729 RepID=UPI003F485346
MQELHDLKDEDLRVLAQGRRCTGAASASAASPGQRDQVQGAKIEKIAFQLALAEGWKFGAKTEAIAPSSAVALRDACCG